MKEMTKEEFFDLYHEFLESIQLIERRLRFIYASLINGEINDNWFKDLDAVGQDTIGKLVYLIKSEEKNGSIILDDNLYTRIDKIRKERNYWVHECFLDCNTFKKGAVRQEAASRIKLAAKEAWYLNEDMFKIEQEYLEKQKHS